MEETEKNIYNQDLAIAATECNANLIVACDGKKAFWYFEDLKTLVETGKPMPLWLFCKVAKECGEPCKKPHEGISISFCARNVPKFEALGDF